MSIEKEYYENDEFWRVEKIQRADFERVETISALIPRQVENILDVGCGNGIFINHLAKQTGRFKRLHGVDRSTTALKYVETEKTIASIDSLPFRDQEFDLVASLEVIEHLPLKMFEVGLRELCRVSREYVLISVPYEQQLERSLIPCQNCKSKFNPDYHMRSFNSATIHSLFDDYGFINIQTTHIGKSDRLVFIPRLSILEKLALTNPFTFEIPCPVCGFYLPGAKPEGAKKKILSLKKNLKKYWPKKRTYRWIAGLYKRQNAIGG